MKKLLPIRSAAIAALSLFLCILVTACGTTQGVADRTNTISAFQEEGPLWPAHPQQPRIKYIGSVSGVEDSNTRKSWFSRAITSILGGEDKDEKILRPYGIFARGEKIWVTDPGLSSVHIFDMQKRKHRMIKKAGEQVLVSPIGVVVDENEQVYVTDSLLRKVFLFDKEGKLVRELGQGQFLRPAGIARASGIVYVVDTHAHKVFAMKEEGSTLFSFGRKGAGNGEFNYPTNVHAGKDGLLYVTDSMNFRVQIFSAEGKFISNFGRHGDRSGNLSKPKGISVDSEGHVYVADAHFDNVQIFDKAGTLLLVFSRSGRGKGEMILPAGIFIDEKDRVYVADSYNNRLQVFQYLRES